MSFSSRNLSYIFNQEYYTRITDEKGFEQNEKVIATVNHSLISVGVPLETREIGTHNFLLQVQYPGLLAGLGYAHDSVSAGTGENIKGSIPLGFSFDYTTGVPYIPGSTVKGVIRNAFTQGDGAFVREFLNMPYVDIPQLESEIFDTAEDDADTTKDAFFDAYPSPQTPKKNTDALFYLMDMDVIAPVRGEGLSAKPIVLPFLKVKPGVVFDFRFKLQDGLISAGKKRALFKEILKSFGIGAKTNVGYGIVDEVNKNLCIDMPTMNPISDKFQIQQGGKMPHATSSVPNKGAQEESRKCPHCGALNFKYHKETRTVRRNWTENVCFKCRGKL